MSDSQSIQFNTSRLLQQADLYEQQGLYDHAVLVYETILRREPDNRKAQAKIIEIRFTQQAVENSSISNSPAKEISPRLTLDLGIAYLGMNLHGEALEEFKKAMKPGSPVRVEGLRYAAICLIHLGKYTEAESILGKILVDKTVSTDQKADIVTQIVNGYVTRGAPNRAKRIVTALAEERPDLIKDCGHLIPEDSPTSPDELMVEDTETNGLYPDAGLEEPTEPGVHGELSGASISLQTTVSYSIDSKTWKEGTSSKLASKWAIVNFPERLEEDLSLVLQIRLPFSEENERVWVIGKVAEKTPGDPYEGYRVNFASFLPGGEAILNGFIDRQLKETGGESQVISSDPPTEPVSIFTALEQEAIRTFEMGLLSEPVATQPSTPVLEPALRPVSVSTPPATSVPEGSPKIRFACECGQLHVVPIKSVGRKGKCGTCGRNIVVPTVDMRPDSAGGGLIGKVVGGSRILYKIGGGGMGGVFKGHHLALDIAVAVKILHGHLAEKDPVFIKRFIREARAAAKLQHPNIVGVMNVGLESGLHFIVMPYIAGGSAGQILVRKGRFRLEQVLHIAVDIARALTVAEEQGMLHRDIKPANILFTAKGDAMLADLGLAKNYLESQDVGITQSGIACGTPLYFSPEQAKGNPNMDIRSDIYSLGITIYNLLDGSPPYKGESAYVIFQKHVHEPLPPFRNLDPPIPDTVFRVLQKMTAKNPEERYANAEILLYHLEQLRDELLRSGRPEKKKGILERLGLKK